jgi:hypothetical protein
MNKPRKVPLMAEIYEGLTTPEERKADNIYDALSMIGPGLCAVAILSTVALHVVVGSSIAGVVPKPKR